MDTLFVSPDSQPSVPLDRHNNRPADDMTRVSDPISGSLIGAAANADRLSEHSAPAPAERSTIAIDTRAIETSGREVRAHEGHVHDGHESPDLESTGGWNAYEVWRRFIKDARDRRKQQGPN